TTIEGVGEVPEIIEALFTLQPHSVTEVTPARDAFYIFRVDSVRPARNVTLEEARASIENILRGQAVDVAKNNLDKELQEVFEPEVDENGLARFWDFALGQTMPLDSATTGAASAAQTTAVVKSSTIPVEAR